MRTTININDELLRDAKKRAAEEGTTLRALMEDALRSRIQAHGSSKSGFELRWRTEKGRLQPGVRLDDRQSLFDLMEGRE